MDEQAKKNAQLEEIALMCGRTLQLQLGNEIGFALVLFDLEVAKGSMAYAHNGASPGAAGTLLIDAGGKMRNAELSQMVERLVATQGAEGLQHVLRREFSVCKEDTDAANEALAMLRAAERALPARETLGADVLVGVLEQLFSRYRTAVMLGRAAMLPPGAEVEVRLPSVAPKVAVSRVDGRELSEAEIRDALGNAPVCERCGVVEGTYGWHMSQSDAIGSYFVCCDEEECAKRWAQSIGRGREMADHLMTPAGRTWLATATADVEQEVRQAMGWPAGFEPKPAPRYGRTRKGK